MKRWVSAVLVLASLLGILLAQTINARSSQAAPCLSGDGSAGSPWLITTSAELQCFESGTWVPAGGSMRHVSLLADVLKTNNTKLFKDVTGDFLITFSGNSHTITIDRVSNFEGLFKNSKSSVFKDFTVEAINGSSLRIPGAGASGYGWVVEQDYESKFENIKITAPISDGNGGIIGSAYGSYVLNSSSIGPIGILAAGGLIQSTQAYPSGITPQAKVEGSFSNGFIGASSGGILGVARADTKITRSYSTGLIDNSGAGGIVGGSVVPSAAGQLLIESSYSTGNIGFSSGGILGQYSSNFVISNVYSTGNISDFAGGITGANASDGNVLNSYVLGNIYLGGEGIFSRTRGANPNLTSANVYVVYGSSNWSDTTAATVLTGFKGWGGSYKWVQCNIDTPALITAFYTRDPCAPEPTPEPSSTSGSSGAASVSTTLPTLANTGVNGMSLNFIIGIAFIALIAGAAATAIGINRKN